MKQQITPRFIRFRDAPAYLGMDRSIFNAEARPHLTEIRIGKQGIAFDRVELDTFADAYKAKHGRRPGSKQTWVRKDAPVSRSVKASGASTKSSSGSEFVKALEQGTTTKRNAA